MSRLILMRRGVVFLGVVILILSLAPEISLAESEEGPRIYLQAGSFEPASGGSQILTEESLPALSGGSGTYLVQFAGPVLEEWKTSVEQAGARLYGYVPDYAFIARADPATLEHIRSLPFVRWVGSYHSTYRVAPALKAVQPQAGESLSLMVQTLPDVNLEAIAAQVATWGGTVAGLAANQVSSYLQVEIPAAQVDALAALDGVLWVEPYFPPELQNNVSGGAIMHAGVVRTSLGLYGSGQVVAVADTGLDIGTKGTGISADFAGRILDGRSMCPAGFRTTWNDHHGHGTHVAGSVLGSGQLSASNPATHEYDQSFAGIAPEAKLVFQAIDDPSFSYLECIPLDFVSGLFKPAYQLGARIHTNSWGGPTGGTGFKQEYGGYTANSQSADLAAWTYKDMLILFAGGNSGVDGDADGAIDRDSTSTPGTAKNVVTVGAAESERAEITDHWGDFWPDSFPADPIFSDLISNNPAGMAAFSGRGPTDDGRVKPDIVAPGTFIVSARSHDPDAGDGWGTYNADYVYMGGTSMATPLTAGASALVREWLTSIRDMVDPSAALMKAVLINGAADMGPGQYKTPREIPATRPNYVSGWGRVDLQLSLAPPAPARVWVIDYTDGLRTTDQVTYTLSIGASGSRPEASASVANNGTFRVTLAWTDYPGEPTAAKALVNNLDLEVIAPNGARYYGNTGLYSSGSDCLRDAKWDKCNNVEGIIIPAAPVGTYKVIVHGVNVPQGPQPFALAAYGDSLQEGSQSEDTTTISFLPVVIRRP